jgi:hypothetical protein
VGHVVGLEACRPLRDPEGGWLAPHQAATLPPQYRQDRLDAGRRWRGASSDSEELLESGAMQMKHSRVGRMRAGARGAL